MEPKDDFHVYIMCNVYTNMGNELHAIPFFIFYFFTQNQMDKRYTYLCTQEAEHYTSTCKTTENGYNCCTTSITIQSLLLLVKVVGHGQDKHGTRSHGCRGSSGSLATHSASVYSVSLSPLEDP